MRVGAAALDIEVTADRAWVDLGDEATLVSVPARGSAPGVRAANGGSVRDRGRVRSVWATSYRTDTVTRLDAETGSRIGEPIATGADPKGIAVGMGAVWVANAGDCALTRIVP